MKMFMNLFVCVVMLFFASCNKLEDVFDHVDDNKDGDHPEFTTDEIGPVHLFLANQEGELPTEPSELVYESRKGNPVIAPGGHHLTLEEFNAVRGKLKMECTKKGTIVSLDLEGLIPFATYSVWVLVFEAPGFTEDFAYEIAEGVPGGSNGLHSSFVAGSDGKAVYSEMVPKGQMSYFGSVTNCLLDEYEVHIVGAYHLDGHTYGGELGPDGKAVEQFGFVYMK
jgi:hypothetical protein